MGAGPDIDAVFEIEDELSESRLQELANAEGPAANGEDQAKKAFPFPQHHQDLPPLAISPPTPLHRSPPSGNQLLEMQRQRPRIQSSESVNSPLSQLFMPLFGRDEGSSDSGNEPSSSLSYGPASRRLSQSRHRRSSTEPQGLVAAGFRSRLPSNVSAAKLLPETVQEIEDEGETSLADIMQQVNEMDERQKRMEKQMEQILQILKPSSTPDNMDQ